MRWPYLLLFFRCDKRLAASSFSATMFVEVNPKQKRCSLSLLDFFRLIRRYWRIILAVLTACSAAAVLASLVVPPRYEATATITVSDPSNNVPSASMLAVARNIAQARMAPFLSNDSDIKATISVGTGSAAQTLTLVIEAPDESECVDLVNSIVANVADESKEIFDSLQAANEADLADLGALNTSEDVASVLSGTVLQDSLGANRTFEFCTFMVSEAVEASSASLAGAKLLLLGVGVGLLVAIAVVLIIDATKMPIRSSEDVEMVCGPPIVADGTIEDLSNRLWANIQFLSADNVRSICLVPLGAERSDRCAGFLKVAIEGTGGEAAVKKPSGCMRLELAEPDVVTIVPCGALDVSVDAAYCAHDASATVICAQIWEDSRRDLRATIRELNLAKARLVGVALFDAKRSERNSA